MSQLSRSSVELEQIYSEKMKASLKFYALVAYPAHVVWLKIMEKSKRHLCDQEYAVLESLPAAVVDLGVEDGDLGVDHSIFLPGLHRRVYCL